MFSNALTYNAEVTSPTSAAAQTTNDACLGDGRARQCTKSQFDSAISSRGARASAVRLRLQRSSPSRCERRELMALAASTVCGQESYRAGPAQGCGSGRRRRRNGRRRCGAGGRQAAEAACDGEPEHAERADLRHSRHWQEQSCGQSARCCAWDAALQHRAGDSSRRGASTEILNPKPETLTSSSCFAMRAQELTRCTTLSRVGGSW